MLQAKNCLFSVLPLRELLEAISLESVFLLSLMQISLVPLDIFWSTTIMEKYMFSTEILKSWFHWHQGRIFTDHGGAMVSPNSLWSLASGTLVPSDSTCTNGSDLCQGTFRLDVRKWFFTESMVKHSNRLLRDVVGAPNLTVSKRHLDNDLDNML